MAGTPITGFSGPLALAITPDGKTAYVVNNGNASVNSFDIGTHIVGAFIDGAAALYGIAITTQTSSSTSLYDINRLRPIYEAELEATKNTLQNAGL